MEITFQRLPGTSSFVVLVEILLKDFGNCRGLGYDGAALVSYQSPFIRFT